MNVVKADTKTHRTTLDLEVGPFERARAILGTRGYKETVNAALREVERHHRLERGAEMIRDGGLRRLNVPDPGQLARVRRSRH